MIRDTVAGAGALLLWVVTLVAALLIGGTLYYTVLPTWRAMDTTGIRASNEFVTTKQALLLTLLDEHTQLEAEVAALDPIAQADVVAAKRSQQLSIVRRMRQEAQAIAPAEIPPAVAQFPASEPS